MHEQDEHEGLCDSNRRSIIPYVYRRELYYCVCVAQFKAELNLVAPIVCLAFYSSRPSSYTTTQGLTSGPRVVGSLYSRALLARGSK
jgi:hypothetical protein